MLHNVKQFIKKQYYHFKISQKNTIIYNIPAFNKEDIINDLKKFNYEIINLNIPNNDIDEYLQKSDQFYSDNYKKNFGKYFTRKAIEHFVSYKLLEIESTHTYLDIASSASEFPNVLQGLYKVDDIWRQDLVYPEGVDFDKKVLGGDASSIPLKENSIDRAAMHCSWEHFEGNSDLGVIVELARILKDGGKLCILPLYISKKKHILSNLDLLAERGMPLIEKDIDVYLQPRPNNHFGRFYDAEYLFKRVTSKLSELNLDIKIVNCSFENDKYSIGTNLVLMVEKKI